MSSSKENCTVCLSPLQGSTTGSVAAQPLLITPCGHKFHVNCLMTWHKRGQPGNYCPLCRQPIGLPSKLKCVERCSWITVNILVGLLVIFLLSAIVAHYTDRKPYVNEFLLMAGTMVISLTIVLANYFAWVYCITYNRLEYEHPLAVAVIFGMLSMALSGMLGWWYLQSQQLERQNAKH